MISLNDEQTTAAGIYQYGTSAVSSLAFHEDIRAICEKNICRCYGTTWACPPAAGSFADSIERIKKYKKILVFNSVYPLKNSFDVTGMHNGHRRFKDVCDALYDIICTQQTDFMLLSNESCIRCEKCTYPDAPCRFPQKLFYSLEGFGINVAELAKNTGLSYRNGENTVTYFGALLYNDDDNAAIK